MYKKLTYIIITTLLISSAVLIYTSLTNKNSHYNQDSSLHYLIFTTEEGGFGYQILSENKTLIKQANIPAIAYNTDFESHTDAEKVALLVIDKISKKESPVITISDLNNLQISY